MKRATAPALLLAVALVVAAGPAASSESAETSPEASRVTNPETEAATEEVAVLETNLGAMAFRFFEDGAPLTTANFKALVGEGFYDGLEFYRVVKGHVIQAGDGGDNGRPTVKGEFGAYPHVTGAVGLARDSDPDSGSTEIYICHEPRPHLDGRYAVFGLLVEGFDVLEAIANVPVEERWDGEVAFHKPIEPVVIERAYLERRRLPAD